MSLHPTAETYAQTILARLPRAGPSSLQDLYGFCEARDGGAQHFVRQAVSHLASGHRIRRIGQGVFAALEGAELPTETAAPIKNAREAAADGPSAETDGDRESRDETAEDPVPAEDRQPDMDKEIDEMQTQTATRTKSRTTRNGAKNGHAKTAARTGSKTDWVLAAVAETGTARFSDLMARAKKEGIFTEAGPLGSTLCGLTKRKKLKKVARGVYAMPGAKVVFDADKPTPFKKRTAEDVKKAVLGRKAAAATKKAAPAGTKPAAKPGRKPSIFRSVYDEFDRKIAKAKSDEKAAAAGIVDVDARIEVLKTQRADFAAKRAAACAASKKLEDSRKRIAGVEADVSESLKA